MAATPFLKRASTNIAEAIRQEFTQEAAITRRLLERVPADRLGWRPHQKSMSVGALALHLASSTGSVITWVTADKVDLPPARGIAEPRSLDDILSTHARSVEAVKRILLDAGDAAVQGTCVLRRNGAVFMTMPRLAILRTLVMNHLVHHRGQLSVYLRLMDVPVPSIYGASADEQPFAHM